VSQLPPVQFPLERTLEEKAASSCVLLLSHNGAGGGSGVLVKRSGEWFCWTAAHVVEGLEENGGVLNTVVFARLRARGIDQRINAQVKRVVAKDKKLDLAVLHLIIPDAPFYSATAAMTNPKLGEQIISCGNVYAKNLPWFVSRGRVTQSPGESYSPDRYLGQGKFLCGDFISYPGCSGSGVLDMNGRLVGIVSATFGPGAMVFIPTSVLHEFALKYKIFWIL
jgi:S1-C subfamily serine protease